MLIMVMGMPVVMAVRVGVRGAVLQEIGVLVRVRARDRVRARG